MTPLLSICVPTYNRAHRLRVMLQTVLPQVAEHADKVELWVSDNASSDQTPKVVEEARRLGPLNYSRNETNLGLVSNVIKAATELARGEFVWVPGDDDLLRPHALARVLKQLEANRHLDLLYLNFRHASYDKHWPEEAFGGYDGPFDGVYNSEMSDRPLSHWHEMVRARNFMCCQIYVHVIRRNVWQDYWRERPRQEDFSDARWSYPHAYMIAETVMNNPSYYVGDPVVTVFEGAQSWWAVRHSVVFNFPGVLRPYRKHGLPEDQARECERMAFSNCEPLLSEILRGEAGPGVPGIASYLQVNWRRAEAWRALVRASRAAGKPRIVSRFFSAVTRLKGVVR
jgi:glycosyltransferase involved in cell wall biosynthesis